MGRVDDDDDDDWWMGEGLFFFFFFFPRGFSVGIVLAVFTDICVYLQRCTGCKMSLKVYCCMAKGEGKSGGFVG